MGEAGEGMNITHQQKKMGVTELKAFATASTFRLPDDEIAEVPFHRPADDSIEMKYLQERRKALGGYLPQRRRKSQPLRSPAACRPSRPSSRAAATRGLDHDGVRADSLSTLLRDKNIGKRVVPIVPDEARTFGMEGMFRQLEIFSQVGQLYKPEDAGPADVLPRAQERPDSAGRHQRGGRDVVVDRGRDGVQHARPADDPVLHLLLDVRVPAHRRSGLGRRRHRDAAASCSAGPPGAPRSTAKACSTRTATATSSPRPFPTACLRSGLRLRARRDHPRRPAPDARRSRKTSSTTSR